MRERIEKKSSFSEQIKVSGETIQDQIDKLRGRENDNERLGFSEWKKIKDEYRQKITELEIKTGKSFKEMPAEITAEMEEKFKEINQRYMVNGLQFLKCQFSDIIKAIKQGKRFEFEAFGPYLRDYFDHLFKESVDGIKLTQPDEIGLAIMKLLKDLFPEGHVISLFDEYNLGVTVADPKGRPMNRDFSGSKTEIIHTEEKGFSSQLPKKKNKGDAKAPPVNLTIADRGRLTNESNILRQEFKKFVDRIIKSRGIAKEGEIDGRAKDYQLISETEKIEDAKKLVKLLAKKDLIEGNINSEKGEIWFQNNIDNCDDPRYLRIRLRDENGHWECAALDASGFLDASNRDIVHLVILPITKDNNFEEQQDKVWEILKTLGFEPKNYHNIFINLEDNPEISPEDAADTVRKKIFSQ